MVSAKGLVLGGLHLACQLHGCNETITQHTF